MIDIQLLSSPVQIAHCITFVQDPSLGGQVVFVGTVRNNNNDKEVLRLEFEAYEPMAIKEMKYLATQAINEQGVNKISMHHRLGIVLPGEIAICIAVSSAHRKEAFESCQLLMDRLKQTVPIWKKEIFVDGEIWVAAHP